MRQTSNLGLALYDASDKMNITGAENSLNHNMELIDEAIHNIPAGEKGDPGDSATVEIGTVTTLQAGSQATVQNVGTTSSAVLNFGIPKGDKGSDATVDLTPYRTSAEQDVIDEGIMNRLTSAESRLGLPASVKSAILECFSRVAWTDADGLKAYQKLEATLDSMGESSGGGDSGSESGDETLKSYRVTYNLENCTVDNRASIITEGKNYVSSIVPNDGYELLSCSVTIGDVTTEIDDGIIIVNGVTSDITINAVCSVTDLEISSDDFISGKNDWRKKESTIMNILTSQTGRTSWVGLDVIIKANQSYMVTVNLVDNGQTVSPIQYGVQRFNKKTYDEASDGEYISPSDSSWRTALTYTFTDTVDEYVMFAFNAAIDTTKSNIKSIRIEKVV